MPIVHCDPSPTVMWPFVPSFPTWHLSNFRNVLAGCSLGRTSLSNAPLTQVSSSFPVHCVSASLPSSLVVLLYLSRAVHALSPPTSYLPVYIRRARPFVLRLHFGSFFGAGGSRRGRWVARREPAIVLEAFPRCPISTIISHSLTTIPGHSHERLTIYLS